MEVVIDLTIGIENWLAIKCTQLIKPSLNFCTLIFFSLRTLCRGLKYASRNPYGNLLRSVYEVKIELLHVLYSAMLHSAALYSTVLHCTIMYCGVLSCSSAILYHALLYCILRAMLYSKTW